MRRRSELRVRDVIDAGDALDVVDELLAADMLDGLVSEAEAETIKRWLRRQRRTLETKKQGVNARTRSR